MAIAVTEGLLARVSADDRGGLPSGLDGEG